MFKFDLKFENNAPELALFDNTDNHPTTNKLNEVIRTLNAFVIKKKVPINRAFSILADAGFISGSLDDSSSLGLANSISEAKAESFFEYEQQITQNLSRFMEQFLKIIKGGLLSNLLKNALTGIKNELDVRAKLLDGLQQEESRYFAVSTKIKEIKEQSSDASTEPMNNLHKKISSIPGFSIIPTRAKFMLVRYHFNPTDLMTSNFYKPVIAETYGQAGLVAETGDESLTQLYANTRRELDNLYKKQSKNKQNKLMPLLKDILDLDSKTPLTRTPTNGELFAKLKTIMINLKRALDIRDAYHPNLNQKEKKIVAELQQKLQRFDNLAHQERIAHKDTAHSQFSIFNAMSTETALNQLPPPPSTRL